MTQPGATLLMFIHQPTGKVITPTDWQRALKPGDHCIMQRSPEPPVYMRIISAHTHPGWFVMECFTTAMPGGYADLLCIVQPTGLLTEDEFEQAHERGWMD